MQWDEMKKEGNEYLLTSRLNQDPLENLFGTLRHRSGYNSNPTAMQLRQNLQYTMYANLTSVSKLTNCKADETISLLAIPNLIDLQKFIKNELNEMKEKNDGQISFNNKRIDSVIDLEDCAFMDTGDEMSEKHDANIKNTIYSNDPLNKCSRFSDAQDCNSDSDDSIISYKEVDEFVEDELGSTSSLNEVFDCKSFDTNLTINEELSETSLKCLSIFERVSHNASSTGSTSLYLNSVKYLAGYFAYKCLKKTNCETCENYFVRKNVNFVSMTDLLLFFKAYKVSQNSNELGNLCVPTDEFAEVIRISLDIFDVEFKNVCYLENVSKLILNAIKKN
ncbi:uncharacterized protein [Diabrotica undecimpunctata]|uniref:uncharacterized protein n=1 Tax=Diabrotica undecimpunctata TaxID=50387 RepID=UPI003B6330CF